MSLPRRITREHIAWLRELHGCFVRYDYGSAKASEAPDITDDRLQSCLNTLDEVLDILDETDDELVLVERP